MDFQDFAAEFESPRDLASVLAAWDHDTQVNGVATMRAAIERREEGGGGVDSLLARARDLGLPAELQPYWFALYGAVLVELGRHEEACAWLSRGWADFPDFAALPAFLGIAHARLRRPDEAGRAWFAALLEDDPQRSLETFRHDLTRSYSLLSG